MKNIKLVLFFTIFSLLLIIINCDGNAISEALKKRDTLLSSDKISNTYEFNVSNVSATQVFGSKNIMLSWTNPTDSNFSKIIIVRKENSFANSITDPLVKFVYIRK